MKALAYSKKIMITITARQMTARRRAANLPGERDCKGDCGQGEGDCDWDDDCLPGLKCKFDWWWGEDWCVAGKHIMAGLSNVWFRTGISWLTMRA